MKNEKSTELNFLQEFNEFVNATRNGKRTKQNGTRILKKSVRKLEITYKILKEFSVIKNFSLRIKIFKKLNMREAQREKIYWNKFYQKFSGYMYDDRDCHDNYVGSVIKDLKSFFNYLIVDKNFQIGNYHKKFYVHKESIEIITFQPNQLNFLIYDKEFESSLSKTLLNVKNILVVGCTVALRYSDLMNLGPSNLEKQEGQDYLKVQSEKTKTYTRIKVPDYAVQIFEKYKNKKILLPYYSVIKLNLYFKKLVEKAGWVEEKIKTRQKRGIAIVQYKNKAKKIHYRFCDHITTHTMRRTAITTMLRLQMPEYLVRKISGHAAGSKEFHKYVAISQNHLDSETDKVFDKLNALHVDSLKLS